MKKFLRSLSVSLGLLAGVALLTGAAYPFWPLWLVDVVAAPTSLTFTGVLFQWGQATSVPSHVASAQTTAPALTSCGSSPAIAGTDTSGTVTMGTGTPTGCVITFNVAYTAAPHCNVTWRTNIASMIYAVSTTAITLTQTATSSNVADYLCVAPSGG
jgi:hypothetical protein